MYVYVCVLWGVLPGAADLLEDVEGLADGYGEIVHITEGEREVVERLLRGRLEEEEVDGDGPMLEHPTVVVSQESPEVITEGLDIGGLPEDTIGMPVVVVVVLFVGAILGH